MSTNSEETLSGSGGDASDHFAARDLAEQAGELLLGIRKGIGTTPLADQARHQGDSRSHEFLANAIAQRFPADGLLSEEGADSSERLQRDRVWIVDPLDGTREFGEPPRTDWAVHVCLAVGGRPVAGAVALPARGLVLSTAEPQRARKGAPGPLRIAVSRSRPPAFVERLAEVLGADLVPMGSAGAKAAAVVLGDADVYVHAGGQYEWDSAAPVAVARSAGLHASRIDGSPLVYNQPNPWLPDLVICRAERAEEVLHALNAAGVPH